MDRDPTADDRQPRDPAAYDPAASDRAASDPATSGTAAYDPATERTSAPGTSTPEPATRDHAAAPPASPSAEERPRVVVTDPSLDQHQRQGVTGGTWIALILGTLILILLLIFILQNNVGAEFSYFGWTFALPLGIAMLFAAIAGVLVTALLGSVRLFKLSRRVRKLEKEREQIKRAMR
ncbi:LapA family protein [Agrococcus sp. ARC_14]|uniref:LapA family protein n=1 Tax=Agrococcus sp. ARC_14 TaxID=2919927 RepID=UPI001F0711F9|nr:LapA family protein [Agrococcus sp. ARC_14]MCH1881959.1 LapA family protein [Agrococcus sp. ARC_14]